MAMLKLEIDGKSVEVPNGATVMEAANKLGVFVPHFCYHKKLSIAANCRMCLVQVEKAPKAMPACATPATDGMKVWTQSEPAVKAQKSVMEFLLINHPLDCPICDQGGECQLQDLAVGYGGSASRYDEPKRVIFHKNIGPLVSAEEMSRCIQCTRCVRFGQEVAGVMELGMINRGEHSEIVSFVGRTVDSELSGNMIDICPVGALTSKPFRYSARTWELTRRKSIAPHDSLGSNLVVQIKHDKVMRVVPLENEAVNECWISDKDRFSYEGLNSPDRLTKPMIKDGAEWREIDWPQALELAGRRLGEIRNEAGGEAIGTLVSPHATLEEMALAQKLARGLGSDNVDFRLRRADFSADGKRAGIPWLGMSIADIGTLDRVLVVGSFLRKDHPLIASRLRQATKRGVQLNIVHSTDDDLLMSVSGRSIVTPRDLPMALARIVRAVADAKGVAAPQAVAAVATDDSSRAIAASLASGKSVGILLGNFAEQHPQATELQSLAQILSGLLSARFGFIGEAANSVGGYVANCVPTGKGLNAGAMLGLDRTAARKAYVLVGVEPDLDCQDPVKARAALAAADFVVALTPFRSAVADHADLILPSAPFTETSGTFVNCEGRAQSFNAVVKSLGESRPAWKILRVLGNQLGLAGFEYDNSESIRDEILAACPVPQSLNNSVSSADSVQVGSVAAAAGLQRIADVPIYFADALVRRAESLQKAADAKAPKVWLSSDSAQKAGVEAGQRVRIRQAGEIELEVAIDTKLPAGCARIAAGHVSTAALGAMSGELSVVKA
jgi:NADH-quinone oxidoreductase subunit G